MKSINALKKFSEGNLLADLAAASAASLTAALFTSLVNLLSQRNLKLVAHIRFILLAAASYLAIALFLHRFWAGRLRHLIPNWILIAVFGSILFTFVRLTPGIIKGWYDPLKMESSLIDYLLAEIIAARSVIIILSLLTLPVAWSTYYILKKLLARSINVKKGWLW
jgi:hypothetical protein